MVVEMELALRIEDARSGAVPPTHVGDVVVQAEPSHTIRSVADAVAEAIGLAVAPDVPIGRLAGGRHPASGGARANGRHQIRIDDRLTVVEAGLVSGDALVIGGSLPVDDESAGRPRLVVTSGPDAGRSAALGWGEHVVGRDDTCQLVLTDPQVSRRHLAIEVAAGPDGAPRATLQILASDRNPVRSEGVAVTGEVT
ncbi:MAG: FHA domain-containing protein, partial [Actinomycetota bacterium]